MSAPDESHACASSMLAYARRERLKHLDRTAWCHYPRYALPACSDAIETAEFWAYDGVSSCIKGENFRTLELASSEHKSADGGLVQNRLERWLSLEVGFGLSD